MGLKYWEEGVAAIPSALENILETRSNLRSLHLSQRHSEIMAGPFSPKIFTRIIYYKKVRLSDANQNELSTQGKLCKGIDKRLGYSTRPVHRQCPGRILYMHIHSSEGRFYCEMRR